MTVFLLQAACEVDPPGLALERHISRSSEKPNGELCPVLSRPLPLSPHCIFLLACHNYAPPPPAGSLQGLFTLTGSPLGGRGGGLLKFAHAQSPATERLVPATRASCPLLLKWGKYSGWTPVPCSLWPPAPSGRLQDLLAGKLVPHLFECFSTELPSPTLATLLPTFPSCRAAWGGCIPILHPRGCTPPSFPFN